MKRNEYSEEIAKEICEEISSTPKGLNELCRENPHWPDRRDIYRWALNYPSFYAMYARAKFLQVEWLVEDAIIRAKDGAEDTYIDEKGKKKCNTEWVQRSRLVIDTIKWYASKLAPRIYGERLQISNEDDSQINIQKAKEIVEKMKEELNQGEPTKEEPTQEESTQGELSHGRLANPSY